MIALANERAGHRLGDVHASLYKARGQGMFRDVMQGTNGDYSAGEGYDVVSGLGSPLMAKIVPYLAGH